MLVAAMIKYHIHHYFYTSVMKTFQQRVKILHRSKLRLNICIIADIITIIFIGRRIQGV